jgi:3-oxoacyl-[acyl-carrier-protein] synthase II
MTRSVVVTGIAVETPFGRGLDRLWEGLIGARSAVSPVHRFDTSHKVYRTQKAATVPRLAPEIRGQTDSSAIDIVRELVDELCEQTGARSCGSPYDTAVCLGSSQSGANTFFQEYVRLRGGGASDADFTRSRQWLSSGSLLGEVAKRASALGPAILVSTACASGTSSIGIAYDMIRRGRIQRAIAGGVGYYTEISFSGFNILRLTGRDGCKPFDAERDGMMLGDGFAFVMLEEESSAMARGASVHARILGYASANEAHHATSPDPSGEAGYRVMWNALGKSSANLARLDYINAHGTGTLANDTAELTAIRRLLVGGQRADAVAISSTKGALGHSLGGAGSVEFVATVLSIQKGAAPPTIGLRMPQPGFEDLTLVQDRPDERTIRVALSNSFAFGGNVAAIAVTGPGGP